MEFIRVTFNHFVVHIMLVMDVSIVLKSTVMVILITFLLVVQNLPTSLFPHRNIHQG